MIKTGWKKIAKEYVVSLFPVYMLVDAFSNTIRNRFDLSVRVAVSIKDHCVEYFFKPNLWDRAHKVLVKRVRNNPRYLSSIFFSIIKEGKRLVSQTKKLTVLSGKESNKQLWRFYDDFVKQNLVVYAYGLLLSLLDYQHSTFLTDELKAILAVKKAEELFPILTTPVLKTNARKQDIALLQLLKQFKKNRLLTKQILALELPQAWRVLKINYPQYAKLLTQHARKYNWVYYVYEGPALDEEYFLGIIKDHLKNHVNPEQKLKQISKEEAKLKNTTRLFKRLKFTNYERQIAQLARDIVDYKAIRRELQSLAYYHAEFLLREIGRRLGLTLAQTRMLLPREIKAGLIFNRVDLKAINDRFKHVVYGAPKPNSCLSGQRAEVFAKKYFPADRIRKKPSILNGTVAYKGLARGRVCIVNTPKDMQKMPVGGILVSVATSPNLMPAIRKAAAIVTDEGGLTCHAAIVSRELKIPCVVGTKIATKVLRDGDTVKVDAKRGIVRKMSK